VHITRFCEYRAYLAITVSLSPSNEEAKNSEHKTVSSRSVGGVALVEPEMRGQRTEGDGFVRPVDLVRFDEPFLNMQKTDHIADKANLSDRDGSEQEASSEDRNESHDG
jgi:hypothetical protein